MTEVERILVVGGGIGGLSTSIALRRAGFAVDVVEKNPSWDVYGVGMIQPANALRVLHEIGLAEQCVAAGHPMYGDKTWLRRRRDLPRRARLGAARRGPAAGQRHRPPGPAPHPAGRRARLGHRRPRRA